MAYKVDKNMQCDVAGDVADLIFVFFDPIGQALCKRTLSLVEKLNEKHAERMRFYLSKADEAGHEADRQVIVTLCQWDFTDFLLTGLIVYYLLQFVKKHSRTCL